MYLALIGIAVAVLIPVGAKIGEQASTLASRLPGAQGRSAEPLSFACVAGNVEAARDRILRRTDHGNRG